MRAKTLIELLTLSTNLYMISKDEEFIKNLSEMMQKGKRKAEDIINGFSEEEEEEEKLIDRLLQKLKHARQDLENKIEETAEKVYDKLHIAHADEVKRLSEKIEALKRELSIAEARIVNLESKRA